MTERQDSFGAFITQKRLEQGLTIRRMAERLEITPTYLCDMEKARRMPPEKALLGKMTDALCLTKLESANLYDMAGERRGEVSPDLHEYIMSNSIVRAALRKAMERNIREEVWLRIIQKIDGNG